MILYLIGGVLGIIILVFIFKKLKSKYGKSKYNKNTYK